MSIGDFLSQGGYGFYVWMSYGGAAVLLAAEVMILRRRGVAELARQRRLQRLRTEDRA